MYTSKLSEQNQKNYSIPPDLYDRSLPQITTAKEVVNSFIESQSIKNIEVILDACCGTGSLTEYLGKCFPGSQVVGIDNASNMIQYAKQYHAANNISFKEEDITLSNPFRKKFADLIVCSWAVSHIPSESQQAMASNLCNYLKDGGKLLILFPVMGSLLSITIQEIVKSDRWQQLLNQYSGSRVTYSEDAYDDLLKEAGFIQRTVSTEKKNLSFKNKDELNCFVTTAVARYLPFLKEQSQQLEFIDAISALYLSKVGSDSYDIPYTLTLLIAVATRPTLSFLNLNSPIHHREENKDTMSDHETPSSTSYGV